MSDRKPFKNLLYSIKYNFTKLMYSIIGIPTFFLLGIKYHRYVTYNMNTKNSQNIHGDIGNTTQMQTGKSNNDMEIIFLKISSIPFKFKPIPSFFSTHFAFLPDVVIYSTDASRVGFKFRYNYPSDFKEIELVTDKKTKLSGMVAFQKEPEKRPAIILVGGLFVGKYQHTMIRVAKMAFYRWNYSVLVVDMRDFGYTSIISDAPFAGTIKEGEDIICLAKWFKREMKASKVFISGYSYGASAILSAIAISQHKEIDAAVIFSPFTNIITAVNRLSTPQSLFDPFWALQLFFNWLFIKQCRSRKLYDIHSFNEYINKVVFPYYGLDWEAFVHRACPINFVDKMKIPTLVIHPQDDPVVNWEHSSDLQIKASLQNNPNIKVLFVRRGGHYANWLVSPKYTEKIVYGFFEFWNSK